jgi:hypothetical protein
MTLFQKKWCGDAPTKDACVLKLLQAGLCRAGLALCLFLT